MTDTTFSSKLSESIYPNEEMCPPFVYIVVRTTEVRKYRKELIVWVLLNNKVK